MNALSGRPSRGPVERAEAAAEAVRALCQATLSAGFANPTELDEVVADLALLAQRLPQAVVQCSRWLELEVAAGRVEHDTGADPLGAAAAVRDQLGLAVISALDLNARLDAARQHTARLFGVSS